MTSINYLNFDLKRKSKVNIYGKIKNNNYLNINFIEELEIAWINYFIKNSPHSNVIKNNIFRNQQILNSKYLDFVHVTPSITKIMESKKIFGSSGGLGYAVYCSLLINNHPHNIVDQYLNFQLKKKGYNSNLILIRAYLDNNQTNNLKNSGIDYTFLGKLNLEAWDNIKNNIPNIEINNMNNDIIQRINKLYRKINRILRDCSSLSHDEFNNIYSSIFTIFPELRFIIYEIMAEYVLFFQDDKESMYYSENFNELYNLGHKKIVYDICPSMFEKFKMNNFFVEFNYLIDILEKANNFNKFDRKDFYKFFKWRLYFYLLKMFEGEITETNFESIRKNHPNFLGQVVYRYNSQWKELIEIEKAKLLKSDWRKKKILFPIYSVIPKGEMGINPDIDFFNIKYHIYSAEYDSKNNTIVMDKELPIKIVNKLIEKNKASVR